MLKIKVFPPEMYFGTAARRKHVPHCVDFVQMLHRVASFVQEWYTWVTYPMGFMRMR